MSPLPRHFFPEFSLFYADLILCWGALVRATASSIISQHRKEVFGCPSPLDPGVEDLTKNAFLLWRIPEERIAFNLTFWEESEGPLKSDPQCARQCFACLRCSLLLLQTAAKPKPAEVKVPFWCGYCKWRRDVLQMVLCEGYFEQIWMGFEKCDERPFRQISKGWEGGQNSHRQVRQSAAQKGRFAASVTPSNVTFNSLFIITITVWSS